MSKDKEKINDEEEETVAVLLRIPKTLYMEYLKIVNKKSLKRQKYSSDIFCEAIQKIISE